MVTYVLKVSVCREEVEIADLLVSNMIRGIDGWSVCFYGQKKKDRREDTVSASQTQHKKKSERIVFRVHFWSLCVTAGDKQDHSFDRKM